MNRKEAKEIIIIPGKPEEIDLSRVHGGIGSGIRFELSGEESYFGQMPQADELKDYMNRGGRVFITEDDDYLMIDPQPENPDTPIESF